MKKGFVFVWLFCSGLLSLELWANKCTQQSIYKSLEVTCETMPDQRQWGKINKSTTHLLLKCSDVDSNTTLYNNRSIYLPKLAFFSVKDCPLFQLPKEYFRDLIYLENVVLDNLPLKSLPNNLFRNSSNVLEVSLIRLGNLRTVFPRFTGNQNKLEKLHIIETNVSAEDMKPILISVYITLTDLYWRQNKQKLIFEETYFRELFLNNLILELNDIDDTAFLSNVHAKRLSLKHNPIAKYGSVILPPLEGLESLNLAFTGLRGVWGDKGTITSLNTVKELILSDNMIEGLLNDINIMLPVLEILDVRNNQLSTLPNTLHHMLTSNAGRILLTDNLFHCNCEMRWIVLGRHSLANDLLCRTMATETGVKPSNETLAKVKLGSELICTLPKLELELHEEFKDEEYLITDEKDSNTKIYDVVLGPSQYLNWRCVGLGDPAPRLKWISQGQTLKMEKPTDKRYNIRTVMKNLVIEPDNRSLTYTCRGTNTAGDATARLRLVRSDKSIALLAKIVSPTKGYENIYRLSHICMWPLITFSLIYLH